jgi:hypothetical protein
MNKKLAIILIGVAFFVGVVGGGVIAFFFAGRTHVSWLTSQHAVSIMQEINVLKQLRTGLVTNATNLLEHDLNCSIRNLTFWTTITPIRPDQHAVYFSQCALVHAKEYRLEFPYEGKDSIAEITKTLSSISLPTVQTNK